jgi:hypothetical protein
MMKQTSSFLVSERMLMSLLQFNDLALELDNSRSVLSTKFTELNSIAEILSRLILYQGLSSLLNYPIKGD